MVEPDSSAVGGGGGPHAPASRAAAITTAQPATRRLFPVCPDLCMATVRPMHLEFVEPSKRWADVIVPEGGAGPAGGMPPPGGKIQMP